MRAHHLAAHRTDCRIASQPVQRGGDRTLCEFDVAVQQQHDIGGNSLHTRVAAAHPADIDIETQQGCAANAALDMHGLVARRGIDQDQLDGPGETAAQRSERAQRQGEAVMQHHHHAERGRAVMRKVERPAGEKRHQRLGARSCEAARLRLGHGFRGRRRGIQLLRAPDRQIMSECVACGIAAQIVAHGAVFFDVVFQVDRGAGRAQLEHAVGQEMLVAVAQPAFRDGGGHIGVSFQIELFGEFRQRIERRRRVVRQVVMQRRQVDAPGKKRRHRIVAPQIPGRVEIDAGRAVLALSGVQALDMGDEPALRPGVRRFRLGQAGAVDRRVEEQAADAALARAVAQVMVVAVDQPVVGERRIGQVGMAAAVLPLVEQPVRAAIARGLGQIDGEARGRAAAAHGGGGGGLVAQEEVLVEERVGRGVGSRPGRARSIGISHAVRSGDGPAGCRIRAGRRSRPRKTRGAPARPCRARRSAAAPRACRPACATA